MGNFLCGVETFCECPLALHRQQPEKGRQNLDRYPHLENFLRTPMGAGSRLRNPEMYKVHRITKRVTLVSYM